MSDTTKDAVLKPCPFCGGKAEIDTVDKECFGVGCPNCDFQLMNGPWAMGWHRSELSAAEEWNRRAPAQVQAEAVRVGSETWNVLRLCVTELSSWMHDHGQDIRSQEAVKRARAILAAPASSAGDMEVGS
jgi:hypothetical protein